jgi:replicative DNA helicase
VATNEAYRNLIYQLKALLPDYLTSRGINIREANFCCISPEHQDSNPSCLIEGLPTSGPEFLTDNVYYLAERFGIPYEKATLSDDDRHAVECYRGFELATSILINSDDGSVAKELYGWDLQEVREKAEPFVGTIDWTTFAKQMKAIGGFTQVYMETKLGIKPSLFGSNLLTFAIKNRQGATVGFAARDKRYGTDNRIKKWNNTSSEVPIYKKGSTLYGINVKPAETGPLYVVEGQPDVVELRLKGLQSVVAYGGQTISENQARLIERTGKTDIIVVPDNEENKAGDKGIVRALDKVFHKFVTLKVKIKELPLPEGITKIDPGDYLKKNTLKEFLALEDQEAFQWRLKRFPVEMSPDDVYDRAMPLVCEEKNPVRRDRMLQQLAERTDVDVRTLKVALEEALTERRKKGRQMAERLMKATRNQLDLTDVKVAPEMLRKAADDIEAVQTDKYEASAHGPEEFASFLQELKKEYDSAGSELPGWKTGFPSIDLAFDGLPRRGCMLVVAGDTNSGKSIMAQNLGLQTAMNNKNTAVLIFTIDDDRKQTSPRLLSQMTSIPISAVKRPKNPAYGLNQEHLKALDTAWGDLKSMISHGRLDMKDASQGTSLQFAKAWIRDTRQKHPNWDILFVLDSLHKLTGLSGDGGREKIEFASNELSRLTKTEGVTIICTAELRKRLNPQQRPTIDDIKGSNQIGYDSTISILLHNTMHANPRGKKDQAEAWIDPQDGQEKPIIQLHVDKNKETSYKDMFRMRIRPDTSQLLELEVSQDASAWENDPAPIDL